MTSTRDLRGSVRIPLRQSVSFRAPQDDVPRDGVVTDIARDGLFISTQGALPPGTRVITSLRFERFGLQLDLDGVVLHAAKDGGEHAGMGIRLDDAPPTWTRLYAVLSEG